MQQAQSPSWILLAVIGLSAAALLSWTSACGPGVDSDSVVYLEMAQSLRAGDGFFADGKPVTHFPPVYPLLLAAAGFLQPDDLLQACRLLHIVLFAANAVLVALAVQMSTRRSLPAVAGAALIFLSSAPVIAAHTMAWSEAPFLTFSLAAIIALSLYIRRPCTYRLLAASVLFGLAIGTRYVGVTLLPPMIAALLLCGKRPARIRIQNACAATAIACLPTIAWMIRNVLIAGTATNRSFAFHPPGMSHARAFVATMHNFALPVPLPDWMKGLDLAFAAALFGAVIVDLHRERAIGLRRGSVGNVIPLVCVAFCMVYLPFLAVSLTFFDAHTPLNGRTLLPVFVLLLVAVISLAWLRLQAVQTRFLRCGVVAFLLLCVGTGAVRAAALAIHLRQNGTGYTSRPWRDSETLSQLKSLGRNQVIYSNGPDVVRFLTGKESLMIPRTFDAVTRIPNGNFEKDLQGLCGDCRRGDAIIAYLNGITWRSYLPDREELEARCDLPVLKRFDDGVIYGTHAGERNSPKSAGTP